MFKFDDERGMWVPFKYSGTYTEVKTVYGDTKGEFPDGADVKEISLSVEQLERLSRAPEVLSLDDLNRFVMDGERIPGSEGYFRAEAVASVLDRMTDDDVVEAYDMVAELAEQWTPGVVYPANRILTYDGQLYRVRQPVVALEHQPPGSVGLGSVYFPIVPAGQIADFDPTRNLAEFPFQVGELIRFSYGVYECLRVTNFSPQEYAPDWAKRDDLV